MGNVETLFPWVMWFFFALSVGTVLWAFVAMMLAERATFKALKECVAGIEWELLYDRKE